MENLHQKLVDLLGTTYESLDFSGLLKAQAHTSNRVDSSIVYEFLELGLSAAAYEDSKILWMIGAEIATPAVIAHATNSSKGKLFRGITADDEVSTVSEKLNLLPFKVTEFKNKRTLARWESGPLIIECTFSPIHQLLESCTVYTKPANLSF